MSTIALFRLARFRQVLGGVLPGRRAAWAALLGVVAFHGPALAGPASDLIRRIYLPELVSVTAPEFRDRFTEPALATLKKDDKLSNNGEEIGCIDWDLAIDAQDFDQATIARTLRLSEKVDGDQAKVTARFGIFPQSNEAAREIVWTLSRVGRAWKIADIESVTGGWRLGALPCEP